jgi:hypothetical protein
MPKDLEDILNDVDTEVRKIPNTLNTSANLSASSFHTCRKPTQ